MKNFSKAGFTYEVVPPSDATAALVCLYCRIRITAPTDVVRVVLPYPGCQIMQLVSGSVLMNNKGYSSPIPLSAALLGQPTMATSFRFAPGTELWFARMKQPVLKALAGSKKLWADKVLPLHTLPLCGKLPATQNNTFASWVAAMESYASDALQLFASHPRKDWILAAQQCVEHGCTTPADRAYTDISLRQSQRLFRQYFDMSSRTAVMLDKLNRALDHYAATKDVAATSAAYEGGFADQAHFIKAFRHYSNTAPARFFRHYNLKR